MERDILNIIEAGLIERLEEIYKHNEEYRQAIQKESYLLNSKRNLQRNKSKNWMNVWHLQVLVLKFVKNWHIDRP